MVNRIETEFLGVKVKSPITLAAGVMGMSFSTLRFSEKHGAGVVTSKSYSLNPRKGHEGPVVAEFAGGFLNSMGLPNPGIENGLRELIDFKKISDCPVIINIYGASKEEFVELAKYLNKSHGEFIELNLSCPNVFDEFGVPLAASKDKVAEIVKAVKEVAELPVIAKLSPNVTDITEIALAAENAGADALCMINTVGPGMLIDTKMVKPELYNKFGGVSGPAIKPVALKLVYEAYSKINIPIIGTGGVNCGLDAIEMWMAGGTLIGVGTAVYYRGIEAFDKINKEMIAFLDENGYEKLEDVPRLKKLIP